MLWLYLLGVVTFLIIVLRRVLHRLTPLNDELYSKAVAIDHVFTGVAWVGKDGKLGAVNAALARALEAEPGDLIRHDWYDIFAPDEHAQVREAYRQMLLAGKASFEARGLRSSGTLACFEVLLVAVHDHKMRFVGHHCMVQDRTYERELEERLAQFSGESPDLLQPEGA